MVRAGYNRPNSRNQTGTDQPGQKCALAAPLLLLAVSFERVGRQGLVASTGEFLSQLRQSAEDEPEDLPSQSRGLKP